MLAELRFRHSRDGDASPLTVTLTAEAAHGAIGPEGISPALGFPRGVIDAQGWLKRKDGEPYLVNPASRPMLYRVQVYRGNQLISSVTFAPVATNGVIDVNALAAVAVPLPVIPLKPSVDAGLPGTAFIVADEATKTATLYWKFQDGTVKALSLT